MERIKQIQRSKLADACDLLKLEKLTADDYEFIDEYQQVMDTIASAIKVLESDKYTFGLYLPTLFGLRNKLFTLKNQSNHCLPLIKALMNGFELRFAAVLDIYNAKAVPGYVAMVSNPSFKLNYMNMNSIPSHIRLRVKQMLTTAALDIWKDRKDKDVNNSNDIGEEKENGKFYACL